MIYYHELPWFTNSINVIFQLADCSDSVHLGTDGGGSVCQTSFARHGFSHAIWPFSPSAWIILVSYYIYLNLMGHMSRILLRHDTSSLFSSSCPTQPFSHHIQCFRVATQKCQVSSAHRFHGWPWVGVCLLPGQCVLAAVENSWENRSKDLWDPMDLQESCFLVMIWKYDFWGEGIFCALWSSSGSEKHFGQEVGISQNIQKP